MAHRAGGSASKWIDHLGSRMGRGGSNSVVESQPSKLLVAGSIPVSRSSFRPLAAACLLRQGVPDGGYDWSEGVAQSHPGLWTGPATGGVRPMTDQADVAQL